ncbi:MAG: septal ring lytic transglycosylase RlpA family protein [Chitinophagaceae bacterium]|nr:septal ring lytic transglycosylase RlpA family protein [Chitinophagaceae bacterium]
MTIPETVRRFVFLTVCSFLFLTPIQVSAQDEPVVRKDPTEKSRRVFYGLASYYSNKFNGRKTASGEIFSQKKMTCACNVLPLGTWVKVTNLRNGRSVIVKTNDRIHPKVRRVVDLSRVAAEKLGYISRGLTRVKVEVIGRKPPE